MNFKHCRFLPLNCPLCGRVIFYTPNAGERSGVFIESADDKTFSVHGCYVSDPDGYNRTLNVKKLKESFALYLKGEPDILTLRDYIRLTLTPGDISTNFVNFGLFLGASVHEKKTGRPGTNDDEPGKNPTHQKWRCHVMKADGKTVVVECGQPPDITPGEFAVFRKFRKTGLNTYRSDTMAALPVSLARDETADVFWLTVSSAQADILEHRIGQLCDEVKKKSGKMRNAYPTKISFRDGRELYSTKICFCISGSVKPILEHPSFSNHTMIRISQAD